MTQELVGYYTLSEFRDIYPMGNSTLYRIAKQGKLRITKFGGASRIAKADAAAWAAGLLILHHGTANDNGMVKGDAPKDAATSKGADSDALDSTANGSGRNTRKSR